MARHRRPGLFLSTQSDHVSRLISKELFQGEIGAFLQSVGLSPDTPCNIAQTAETFATTDARYRENLAGFVDRINRHVNGLRIKPLFLMPETVWEGEYRNFLFATCRFYPADPANVFFLADTRRAAEASGLPLQANASAQEAHKFAVHLVGTLGNMYEKGIAEGNNKHEVASVMSEQARTICIYLAAKLFDGPQIELEHKLFGPPLGRNSDKILPPKV